MIHESCDRRSPWRSKCFNQQALQHGSTTKDRTIIKFRFHPEGQRHRVDSLNDLHPRPSQTRTSDFGSQFNHHIRYDRDMNENLSLKLLGGSRPAPPCCREIPGLRLSAGSEVNEPCTKTRDGLSMRRERSLLLVDLEKGVLEWEEVQLRETMKEVLDTYDRSACRAQELLKPIKFWSREVVRWNK